MKEEAEILYTEKSLLSTIMQKQENIKWARSVLKRGMLSNEGQLFFELLSEGVEEYGKLSFHMIKDLVEKQAPTLMEYYRMVIATNPMETTFLPNCLSLLEKIYINKMSRKIFLSSLSKMKTGNDIEILSIINELRKLKPASSVETSFDKDVDKELVNISDGVAKDIELGWGLKELDDLIGGFHRGELYVIGAGTSTGKTACALSSVISLLEADKSVLLDSLEGGRSQIIRRLLSMKSGFSVFPPNSLKFGIQELDFIKEQTVKIKKWRFLPVYQECDIPRLHSIIGRFKPDVVFVDYLQLFPVPSDMTTARGIGEIARKLKLVAEEEDINITLLSQLNRGGVGYKIKPTLKNLKESGDIENHADIVVLLYREWFYNKNARRDGVEIIVAKNRNGPTGTVDCSFDERAIMFKD